MRRWLSIIKPLAKEVAEASRAEEIRCLEAEIEERRIEIEELKLLPLGTTTKEYVPVYPDDPQWEQASDRFDPREYKGTWKFQTIVPVPEPLKS